MEVEKSQDGNIVEIVQPIHLIFDEGPAQDAAACTPGLQR